MFLVTGASGNVGGELVHALLAADHQVRALTRGDRPAGLPAKVDAVAGDLNHPETLSGALTAVRGVFLLSGYADMPGLLEAIAGAGVKRVVLLSSGAVVGGDVSNVVVGYNVLSETAVRESGLSWTILRPSGFYSNALQWVSQLREGDVIREPFAEIAVAAIDPFDIAAVAALALTESGHHRASYRLTGPEAIRPADRVRTLARVLDRNLRLEALSNVEARTHMSREMPAEYVEAFFSFFAHGTYDDSHVLPTVKQLTSTEPRTFQQWATAHAKAFQ